jgi:hypothetical protein
MSEADNWSTAGVNILAPDLLDRIRNIVEQQPVIVEHLLYRGSSAPLRLIFDEYEGFFGSLEIPRQTWRPLFNLGTRRLVQK